MSKKITSLFNFKKLQKFSSALMLPIAILPAAGLILAIGISFNIELLANCGGLIFANLPLLFCVGIVIGLTGDGSSSLSAIISYMIMNATMGTQLGITAESVAASNGDYAMILGVPTLQTGVFGGLIVAIFVYLLYTRFHNIELPQFLGFFGENALYRLLRLWRQLLSAIYCRGCGYRYKKVWRRFQRW